MSMRQHRIYALFPLFSGLSFGLLYASLGALLKDLPPSYYTIGSALATLAFIGPLGKRLGHFGEGKLSVSGFLYRLTPRQWAALIATCTLSTVAWIFTIMAMSKMPPTYTALAEMSYVIFTPIFGWLLFGRRELDKNGSIAAALIIIGCLVLVFGHMTYTP